MVRRLVSERQLSLLLDLLEGDRDLALRRLAAMPMGHADVVNRWAGIVQQLNCLGEGATKSGPEWKTLNVRAVTAAPPQWAQQFEAFTRIAESLHAIRELLERRG